MDSGLKPELYVSFGEWYYIPTRQVMSSVCVLFNCDPEGALAKNTKIYRFIDCEQAKILALRRSRSLGTVSFFIRNLKTGEFIRFSEGKELPPDPDTSQISQSHILTFNRVDLIPALLRSTEHGTVSYDCEKVLLITWQMQ